MVGGANIAELFGGLGLFLLGGRLAAAGLSACADRFSAGLERGTRDSVRALGSGAIAAALSFSDGELPRTVARVGRGRGLSGDRVALLAIGASFGPLVTGFLACMVALAWALPALAMLVLLGSALVPLVSRARGTPAWSEMAAGWSLSIIGLASMFSGLAAVGSRLSQELGVTGLSTALLLALLAAAAATALRSPSAIAALALLAAGADVINAWSGAALLVGVALGTPAWTVIEARRGSSNERCLAGGHLLFGSLWFLIGLGFLFSVTATRVVLEGVPGGPRVALLVLHGSSAIAAALLSIPLLGLVEHVVRSRFGSAPAAAFAFTGLAVPQMLKVELLGVLHTSAAAARELVWGALGGKTLTRRRCEEAQSELMDAADAIQHFLRSHATTRLPLSDGCGVLAALRCAESMRALGQALGHLRPLASVGDAALDAKIVHARLAVVQLIERFRIESEGFSAEHWRPHVLAVETPFAKLRDHALAACGSGAFHPADMATLEDEIESLRCLVRAADSAVSDWMSLVGEEEPWTDRLPLETSTATFSVDSDSAAAA